MRKVIWLTGLSGSGKTTIAKELSRMLNYDGYPHYILDGDILRTGLCKDLGFSKEDRAENIRRAGEVCRILYDARVDFIIACFISPYRADRAFVRSLFPAGDFVEVYVKCSVLECEKRDPKGLYKKVRSGMIKNFTGINDPYEEPENNEITINTEYLLINACVEMIKSYIEETKELNHKISICVDIEEANENK